MEKDYTPIEIKAELDKIKETLIQSSKKLKHAAQKVVESSAMDLSSNLIILKSAILDFDNDVENIDFEI